MIQRSAAVLAALLAAAFATAQHHEFKELTLPSGGKLTFALQLPEGHDPASPCPVLLAMPHASQDRDMVEAMFRRYWGQQARRRGWIVISPVAPGESTFVSGAEQMIPHLLTWVRQTYRVAGNGIHLAGAELGGNSAFRIAGLWPYEFASLTAMPGYPPTAEDVDRLRRLKGMRVRLMVGSLDTAWLPRVQDTARRLDELGIDVELQIFVGEGRLPPSLDGEAVMEHLTRLHLALVPEGARAAVDAALDDFHDAAAKGDEDRYFGRFAPEGVFLGTAPDERWTVASFRAFAMPYFQRPSAWIYVPRSRNVTLSPAGDVAWFDEVLGHARYGTCRGTGVLRRMQGAWRLALYDLTVPVPNEIMGGVVEQIAAFEAGRPPATTTVVLVRHAEKADDTPDADLSPAGRARAEALARVLRSLEIDAVYCSERRRTRATVTPLCRAHDLVPRVVPARDVAALVERIRSDKEADVVVVAGHSNTLPKIMAGLGVKEPITIGESDYDGLFVVTLGPAGPRLLRLHYG